MASGTINYRTQYDAHHVKIQEHRKTSTYIRSKNKINFVNYRNIHNVGFNQYKDVLKIPKIESSFF